MAWNQYYWQNAQWPLKSGEEITADHFEDLRKWMWILQDVSRGTYYYDYSVDTNFREAHSNTIFPGHITVIYHGHRWKNSITIPPNGLLTIPNPPDNVHPEPGVWITSNAAWQMVVDEDYYHNYDRNSPKRYLTTDDRGSMDDPEFGPSLILNIINQEGWKQLPRQLDPIENLPPIVYQDTGNVRWQRKSKVEFNRRYVTQPQSLGAVFTNMALTSTRSGNYLRTVDFINWDAITPNPYIRFVYGNQYAHDSNQCGKAGPITDDILPQYLHDDYQWYWNPKVCDAYQNFAELIISINGSFKWPVDDDYRANWSAYFGTDWDPSSEHEENGDTYRCHEYAELHDPFWGCNGSALELVLKKMGRFDWYFDTKHPYIPTHFMAKMQKEAAENQESLDEVMYRWGLMDYSPESGYTPKIKGTWRRTWKRSMGRVCSYNQSSNQKEWFLLRPQEMGEPPTSLWRGGKWPFGIFTTTMPVAEDGFTSKYTLAAIEHNSILVISDEVKSKFKPGSEVWIRDNNEQLWIVYVLSAWEKNGNTYVHIDEQLTGGPVGVGNDIFVDEYLSDRHDPVQIEYTPNNKIMEYELHYSILQDIFDAFKYLKYMKLPALTRIRRRIDVSPNSAGDPTTPVEQWVSDQLTYVFDQLANIDWEASNDSLPEGTNISDSWSATPPNIYQGTVVCDQIPGGYWSLDPDWHDAPSGTAYAFKLASSAFPWDDNVTYSRGQTVLHNGRTYRSLADDNTAEPPDGHWVYLWSITDMLKSVLVAVRWHDQEEEWAYDYWDQYGGLNWEPCDGKDGRPLLGHIQYGPQSLKGLGWSSDVVPQGTPTPWKYGTVLASVNDGWIEFIPTSAGHGELRKFWHWDWELYTGHAEWKGGAHMAGFEMLNDPLFGEIDWDRIPQRCWYRNDKWHNTVTDETELGFIGAIEPPIEPPFEDKEPPQPNPPGFNHTPVFWFRRVFQDGQHVGYDIAVDLTATLCNDLEGSEPIQYRMRIKDENGQYLTPFDPSNWQTNRVFYRYKITETLPLEYGTSARAIAHGDTWRTDLNNPNRVAIPIADTSKINWLDRATHVTIASGPLAGTSQLLSYGDNYLEIYTALYAWIPYTFENEIITVVGATYGQSDWEIDPYKDYGFALQARDSQNNVSRESNYHKHPQLPDVLPRNFIIPT